MFAKLVLSLGLPLSDGLNGNAAIEKAAPTTEKFVWRINQIFLADGRIDKPKLHVITDKKAAADIPNKFGCITHKYYMAQ